MGARDDDLLDLGDIPADFDPSSDTTDLGNVPASFKPPPPPSMTISDAARLLDIGVADSITSVGQLSKALGGNADKVAIGQRIAKEQQDALTPGAKEILSNKIVNDDGSIGPTPFKTAGAVILQSAPGTVAMGLAGGPAGAALGRAGVGAKVAGAVEGLGAPKVVGKLAGEAVETLPFSIAEGAQAGLSQAANIGQRIRDEQQTPLEKLAQTKPFQEALLATDSSLDLAQRIKLARETVANQAEAESGIQAGVSTGTLAALLGGGAASRVTRPFVRGAAQDAEESVFQALYRGAGREAMQEAPQSFGEGLFQNMAVQKYADPEQSLTEDLLNQTVGGAIAGAAMGGGMAAFERGAGAMMKGPDGLDPNIDPTTGAPWTPPVDPGAGPISRGVQIGQQTGAVPTNPAGGPIDPAPQDVDAQGNPIEPGTEGQPQAGQKGVLTDIDVSLHQAAVGHLQARADTLDEAYDAAWLALEQAKAGGNTLAEAQATAEIDRIEAESALVKQQLTKLIAEGPKPQGTVRELPAATPAGQPGNGMDGVPVPPPGAGPTAGPISTAGQALPGAAGGAPTIPGTVEVPGAVGVPTEKVAPGAEQPGAVGKPEIAAPTGAAPVETPVGVPPVALPPATGAGPIAQAGAGQAPVETPITGGAPTIPGEGPAPGALGPVQSPVAAPETGAGMPVGVPSPQAPAGPIGQAGGQTTATGGGTIAGDLPQPADTGAAPPIEVPPPPAPAAETETPLPDVPEDFQPTGQTEPGAATGATEVSTDVSTGEPPAPGAFRPEDVLVNLGNANDPNRDPTPAQIDGWLLRNVDDPAQVTADRPGVGVIEIAPPSKEMVYGWPGEKPLPLVPADLSIVYRLASGDLTYWDLPTRQFIRLAADDPRVTLYAPSAPQQEGGEAPAPTEPEGSTATPPETGAPTIGEPSDEEQGQGQGRGQEGLLNPPSEEGQAPPSAPSEPAEPAEPGTTSTGGGTIGGDVGTTTPTGVTDTPTGVTEAPKKPRKEKPAPEPYDETKFSQLDGREIDISIETDSGESGTATVDAGKTLRDVDKRLEAARALLECIKR